MYLNHYNLKQKPFEVATDPQFIWLGQKHLEVLSKFEKSIQEAKRFFILTGDVGIGKTIFLKRLLKEYKNESTVAMVPDPAMDSLDFINYLSAELNIGKGFKNPADFLLELTDYLRVDDSKNSRIFVAIDEGHYISPELFQVIQALSDLNVNGRKLINIFLVGQMKILKIIERDKGKAVGPPDYVRYHLDPLTENETQQYIQHRLKIAGSQKEIFTPQAIREIYSFSLGYPIMINNICDRALLTGYSDGFITIDKPAITECAQELGLQNRVNQTKT
jgi:general secretion pathway protein A